METKWSILICTIGRREEKFKKLVKTLGKQIAPYKGAVEIVAYWNNGELPLAKIRQTLVESAKGKYISFIDDDDSVPSYYCKEVMDALKKYPDYVGWRMQAWYNDDKLKPTYHSLTYSSWHEDEEGYYRDVSHLNPVKRSIALQSGFVHQDGSPEDYPWAARIRPLLNTEVYIDRIMYHYKHSTDDSTWRGDFDKSGFFIRPELDVKYFRYCV